MKKTAVILARGGSKGIPNKNIIDVAGHPLIYYTIKSALLSDVDEVWVSTDSDKIAEIAKKYEAKVLIRPSELATDTASSELALVHFCKQINSDIVVFIQPTSPLLEYNDINQGLKLLNKYDSVFSGYIEHWYPRWIEVGGKDIYGKSMMPNIHEVGWKKSKRPRRQDATDHIVENGAFYISRRDNILDTGLRYSGKIGFYEMPYSRSFQIDSYDDLFIIESILSSKK